MSSKYAVAPSGDTESSVGSATALTPITSYDGKEPQQDMLQNHTAASQQLGSKHVLPKKVVPGPALTANRKRSSLSRKASAPEGYENHRPSIQLMIAEITEMLRRSEQSILIDPTSPYCQQWDIAVLLALVFTALVTPFEVAFLKSELNALFWINRFVDLVFLKDMIMQFFLMYQMGPMNGNRLVRDHMEIVKHYLKSWFVLDLISILPFDLLSILEADTGSDDGEGSSLSQLKLVRVVRLLRLIKMLRLLRASRLFRKFESSISISSSALKMVQAVMMIAVITHWFACIWTMQTSLEHEEQPTWVTAWVDRQLSAGVLVKVRETIAAGHTDWQDAITSGDSDGIKFHPCKLASLKLAHPGRTDKDGWDSDPSLPFKNGYFWTECFHPTELYVSSAYWAIVTLTSTGYGDIVPLTLTEQVMTLFIVAMGGFAWAYMVASICAALSNLDPQTTRFRQTMDELNHFMADRGLNYDLRKRLRTFLINSKDAMHEDSVKPIFNQLSPQLAADTAFYSNEFLRNNQINFFNACPKGFVVQITTGLKAHCFAEGEKISTVSTMYILKKGLAAIEGRILTRGAVWGEDVILSGISYIRKHVVHCLSYVETLSITRSHLQQILDRHPEAKRVVKKSAVMLAMRRAVVRSAKLLRERKWVEEHGSDKDKSSAQHQAIVAYAEKDSGLMLGHIISRMSKAANEEQSLPQEIAAQKTDVELVQETVRDIENTMENRFKKMEQKLDRHMDSNNRMMRMLMQKMEIEVPDQEEMTLADAIGIGR